MAVPSHGYEPDRLTTLGVNAAAAATSLASITSTDPAASGAIAALRHLQRTLESGWMPAIRAISDSTALSGGVPIYALGGGGSSGSWDESADGPEPGTLTFEPFNALSALFPGDDDITAEDIVARIEEILGADPSQQQWIELGVLGRALEEIAKDEELSADVLVELGAEGLADLYTRFFFLGSQYPINPTVGTAHFDEDRRIGLDLADIVLDPFNAVVGAGAARPDGAAVVSAVIERSQDETYDFRLAAIQGLSLIEELPLELHHELLDALLLIHDDGIERGPWAGDNLVFPDHGDVDDAIVSVITHIIERTADGDLVEILPDGSAAGTGVVFDMAAVLAETGVEITDLDLLNLFAPYLPDLAGGDISSGSSISPQQYRAFLKNLLEDLNPEQTEQALAAIALSAIDRVTDLITVGDLTVNTSPDQLLGELLDNVFGPVVGALADVHGDRETAAAMLSQVLSTLAGFAPSPESKIAASAISFGVGFIIGELTDVDDPSLVAIHEAKRELIAHAINQIYGDDRLREQIGQTALDEWDDVTRHRLGGFGYNDAEIARIKRELDRAATSGDPLPADVFIKLPDVVLLTNSLDEELTLSPANVGSS